VNQHELDKNRRKKTKMKLRSNTSTRIFLYATLVCAVAMQSGMVKAQQAARQNNIMAIDILLEPDATMIQHAQAVNARLLKNYPKGFVLGGSHAPHVSVLQRYVNTATSTKFT